jgi:hypothetical protein
MNQNRYSFGVSRRVVLLSACAVALAAHSSAAYALDDGEVTVATFGARTDGSDALPAFEAAATYAVSSGRKEIIIPGGEYTFASFWTISDSDINIVALGPVTLKRMAASHAPFVVRITGSNTRWDGITFDGNKASTTTACNCVQVVDASSVTLRDCIFQNAKLVGGFGSGIQINGLPSSDSTRYVVEDCIAFDNDGNGIEITEGFNGSICGNLVRGNGGSGISVLNLDVALKQKLGRLTVCDNKALSNGRTGIAIGNYLEDNLPSSGGYGPNNPEGSMIYVAGNLVKGNAFYGLATLGDYLAVVGNVAETNSNDITYAGIYFGARYSTLIGNISNNNVSRGYECGGSFMSEAVGNIAVNNGNVAANLGGCRFFTWRGGYVENNGLGLGATGPQFSLHRFDAGAFAFHWESEHITVTGVRVFLTGSLVGIRAYDGIANIKVTENEFSGGRVNNYIILNAKDPDVRGNTTATGATPVSPDRSGRIYVPDVYAGGEVHTNSAVTIALLDFYSASVIGETNAAWIDTVTRGADYPQTVTAAFTGGVGSGEALDVLVTGEGKIVGIRVNNPGNIRYRLPGWH